MSTVHPERPSLSQSRTRVQSPLAALHKTIKLYVSLEGAAVCVLYVALWFWLAMLLDYGVFRASSLDWVQVLPWGLRCGTLSLVAAGLLAAVLLKVLLRLTREFSDSALALLLERRFPKELGDRLITAVELSNPQEAERHGYSPYMVEETIHQAAERVGKLPVSGVFNWRRLRRYGVAAALGSLGLFLLAGAGFVAARALGHEGRPLAGVNQLFQVSTILVERDVLLRDTLWPRRSQLEIVEVRPDGLAASGRPAKEEGNKLLVGKGKGVSLRVRALKYVTADPAAPEGWRRLAWKDLTAHPGRFGGGSVPELPDDWTPRDAAVGLTADEVELALEQFPVRREGAEWFIDAAEEGDARPLLWRDLTRQKLGGLPVPVLPAAWGAPATLTVTEAERHKGEQGAEDVRAVFARLERLVAVRAALDRVNERAADPAYARAVRRLIVPGTLTLNTYGRTSRSRGQATLEKSAGNEYAGSFGELRETLDYTVKGEDYYTPNRVLEMVELPVLERLESEEERPAGLYYRPSERPGREVRPADLRGERQAFFGGYKFPAGALDALRASGLPRGVADKLDKLRDRTYGSKDAFGQEIDGLLTADEAGQYRERVTAGLAPVGIAISLAGEASTLDVPAGTVVTLTATGSKPLESMAVLPAGRAARVLLNMAAAVPLLSPGAGTGVQAAAYLTAVRAEVALPDLPERVDDRTFRMRVEVSQEHRFTLEFVDTDGEVGRRGVVLNAKSAGAPKVRDFKVDEVIRRSTDARVAGEVYVVSADARVPFMTGTARDEHGFGLRRVRYAYTVTPTDQLLDRTERSHQLSGLPLLLAPGLPAFLGAAYAGKVVGDMLRPAGEGLPTQYAPLPAFERELAGRVLKDGRPETLELATVRGLLKSPQMDPFRNLLRDFTLKSDPWTDADKDAGDPNEWVRADPSLNLDARTGERVALGCDLGLWNVRFGDSPLKERDRERRQRRYQIDVWLEADDTNVDGEVDPVTREPRPGTGRSSETFTFLVVPENELLSKIGDEEAIRAEELQGAAKPLPENLGRLVDVEGKLGGGGLTEVELNGLIARADALDEVLKTSQEGAKRVLTAYERILREMRTNQLRDDLIAKTFRKIVGPLRELDGNGQGGFERTRSAVQALGRELNQPQLAPAARSAAGAPRAAEARAQLTQLIARLNGVLSDMEKMGGIQDLIALLNVLEKSEEDQSVQLKRVQDNLQRSLLED